MIPTVSSEFQDWSDRELADEYQRFTEKARRIAAEQEARRFPPEPPAGENVITFDKQFERGGKVYSYAAIRTSADRRWYLTGRDMAGRTWRQLMDFIRTENVLRPSYLQLPTLTAQRIHVSKTPFDHDPVPF